ncbi:MAG TPA: Gfo/Idh/MocA family oxidoreductase [Vicinamibacterales bacterium]|nr:Gfo/Idh/MocA family oxidoreductase [Vicinamibacterales bacterium]
MSISRRKLVKNAAITGAGLTIVPRRVLGKGMTAPSDTFNVAAVGVGGQGRSDLVNLSTENVVALCDVDWDYADRGFESLDRDIQAQQQRLQRGIVEFRAPASARGEEQPLQTRPMTPLERTRTAMQVDAMQRLKAKLPGAKRYQDYREMLDRQKDIDGVVVATPDHMHASIALAAMDLGRHVYVQKPLCWSVAEARALAAKAKAHPALATQMGNQGHSWDEARTAVEYVQAGAIGDVTDVRIWTNRPLGYWPQGIPRPERSARPLDELRWNGPGVTARIANALAGSYAPPSSLRWDLFLGIAPHADYHPIYHPFNWRGWVDWGCGALGDMGAHLIDHSMWALDLGYPASIETVSTPFNGVSFPHATMTTYRFPARGTKPPVTLTWYDGGLMPARPAEMAEDDQFNPGGGALLIGTRGKLVHETYGAKPRLLPNSLHQSFGVPKPTLPRIPNENHEMNWVDAATGKTQASSPFDYAAKLTEVMLLGIVALKVGRKIEYDGASMRVTNVAAANEFLGREPRSGWSL